MSQDLLRRCRQLRHIEPSNAVRLKYRASAQVHVLVRSDVKDDSPGGAEQSIPFYNWFYAGLNMEQWKSKACFQRYYSQPPNKSAVKDIMDKLAITIATKRMPFAFLVGYHPVTISFRDVHKNVPWKPHFKIY